MTCKLYWLFAGTALGLLLPAPVHAQPLPVKTVEFKSDSVGRKLKFNIILPAKYETSPEQRFAVLYLLHGYSGNYTHWAAMGVPKYAPKYDLIVVMPDAGNSWYVNWAKSEDGQKNDWEDSIIKDMIGHVDANYRTISRREGRAINGLSMGGYGGLMLGLRHPEMFCSIGSHSGAIGIAKQQAEVIKSGKEMPKKINLKPPTKDIDPKIGIDGFSSQFERTPKGKAFTTAEECAAHDPFQLVLNIPRDKMPHIYLDCGTEDPLLADNQAFAKLLIDKSIHCTISLAPGGHNSAFWTRQVGYSMASQNAAIQRELGAEKAKKGGSE